MSKFWYACLLTSFRFTGVHVLKHSACCAPWLLWRFFHHDIFFLQAFTQRGYTFAALPSTRGVHVITVMSLTFFWCFFCSDWEVGFLAFCSAWQLGKWERKLASGPVQSFAPLWISWSLSSVFFSTWPICSHRTGKITRNKKIKGEQQIWTDFCIHIEWGLKKQQKPWTKWAFGIQTSFHCQGYNEKRQTLHMCRSVQWNWKLFHNSGASFHPVSNFTNTSFQSIGFCSSHSIRPASARACNRKPSHVLFLIIHVNSSTVDRRCVHISSGNPVWQEAQWWGGRQFYRGKPSLEEDASLSGSPL